MKDSFLLILIIVLVLGGVAVAQCDMSMNAEKGMSKTQNINAVANTATGATAEKNYVGNVICPVSGEKIKEGTLAQYEYNGKVYNFCCPMCIDAFKQDPEKYIKNLKEKEEAAFEAEASAAAAKK